MDKFYVYALLDERKPGTYFYVVDDIEITFNYEPFYIGKGTGNRIISHEKNALYESNATIKDNKIRKIWSEGKQVIRNKILDRLNEDVAFELEIKLIEIIKRKEYGGPLINLTKGGDGVSNPSPEVRKKISDAAKIRVYSEETREKLRNNWYNKLSRLDRIRFSRKISLEEAHIINNKIIEKTILARKGSKHSEETRQKMSRNMTGIKKGPLTEIHRKNLSMSLKGKYEGINNPMHDKNFRDFRVQKYGEIEEKRLEDERRDKINNTTLQKKSIAEAMFPGTPYNVFMKAYTLHNKGISKEDALKIAEEENKKNNNVAKNNKIEKDIKDFYRKLNDGSLNLYKKELYDVSLFLLDLRKQKGIREESDEINDINTSLNKKFRKNKIKELQTMIDFYRIK